MKKLLLLFFVLCVGIVARGQNYEPLDSNSLQVFYQQQVINGIKPDGHNMWGTRIDSIFISTSGNIVYFNYPIVRDTALERDANRLNDYRCLWLDAPNWNGEKVIVSPEGQSWFISQNSLIVLNHADTVNAEWTAYTYFGGSVLKARVDSIFWVDDIWTQDSVKSISFHRFDILGNPQPDIMNDVTVELYKNNGFRKALDFAKFPMDTVSLIRLDINFINNNAALIEPQQVGDMYTVHQNNHPYVSTYPSNDRFISKKVLDVTPFTEGDSLSIHYLVNTADTTIVADYTTNPPHLETTASFTSVDVYESFIINPVPTFVSIHYGNYMPQEHGAALLYSPLGNYYPYSWEVNSLPCQYPTILYHSCNLLAFEGSPFEDSDSCFLGYIPFECKTQML